MKTLQEIRDQHWVLKKVITYFEPYRHFFVNQLKGKSRIFLFGSGASYNACIASIEPFLQYAHIVPIVTLATDSISIVPLINSHDMIIVVSQSGESVEIKQLCQTLAHHQLDFTAITNNPTSPLANSAKPVLMCCAEEEIGSATKTYTASILLLYLIATCQEAYDFNSLISDFIDISNYCSQNAQTIAQRIHERPISYVLYDSINTSTGKALALLLKEKAHLPVEAINISEFRHGPIEVLQPDSSVLCISSQTNYRPLFQKHIGFLNQIEAQVIMVSDSQFDDVLKQNTLLLPVLSNQNDVFSPLVMTVAIQYIAIYTAMSFGYDVDVYRYTPKVVATY